MTSVLLRGLSRSMIVSGAVLLSAWTLARVHAEAGSVAALERFRSTSAVPGHPNPPVDTSLWSAVRIAKFQESLGMRFDPPVAEMRIPRIGLDAPVLRGADDLTLNRGLGWIAGTAEPGSNGNAGIAGHRDGFFRALKDIAVGDEIELTLRDEVVTYVVRDVKIVEPTSVEVLAPSEERTLTLVTCYPFYFVGAAPSRFIVRAVARSASSSHVSSVGPRSDSAFPSAEPQ